MTKNQIEYVVAYLAVHSLCFSHCSPRKVYENYENEGFRYEEYIIEHEISSVQARNTARAMDIKSIVIPPGCQPCTKDEKKYCLSRDLINDHCCCDKRFREVLPFVPHTCYMGSLTCSTIVGDCAVYERLRTCCCDKYVLEKWKEKSSASIASTGQVTTLFLANILYIFVYIYLA